MLFKGRLNRPNATVHIKFYFIFQYIYINIKLWKKIQSSKQLKNVSLPCITKTILTNYKFN